MKRQADWATLSFILILPRFAGFGRKIEKDDVPFNVQLYTGKRELVQKQYLIVISLKQKSRNFFI